METEESVSYLKYILGWAENPFRAVFSLAMVIGVGFSLVIGAMTINRFARAKSLIAKFVSMVCGTVLGLLLVVASVFIVVEILGGYAILMGIPPSPSSPRRHWE